MEPAQCMNIQMKAIIIEQYLNVMLIFIFQQIFTKWIKNLGIFLTLPQPSQNQ